MRWHLNWYWVPTLIEKGSSANSIYLTSHVKIQKNRHLLGNLTSHPGRRWPCGDTPSDQLPNCPRAKKSRLCPPSIDSILILLQCSTSMPNDEEMILSGNWLVKDSTAIHTNAMTVYPKLNWSDRVVRMSFSPDWQTSYAIVRSPFSISSWSTSLSYVTIQPLKYTINCFHARISLSPWTSFANQLK